MEKSLKEWIDLQLRKNSAATTSSIKQKAIKIFQDIKEAFPSYENITFSASSGWFENFKRREGLHNIKFTGEAASGDHVAARDFPNELNRIIKEGEYLPCQIFNIDETCLYWKRMPKRIYVSLEEKSVSGFKPIKNKVTLTLGSNSTGDYKLKPMLINAFETPRALKGHNKNDLKVIWRSSKKSYMTKYIFREYFKNEL
ncbi:Tigger transposable element-derived protein 1 [Smittium culicis]|uniref:Tigger transposable element-derived protein 1 n=1 Tax=Smittium culicis TaxID=133412 RepID=A0A1R1YNH8_9FUNG|nr:Tigger transposable element-derived protein 1 [Smittium culicis]